MKSTGYEEVLSNLNKEIRAINNRTQSGISEALLHVERTATPLTPVDTGNLRGSFYRKNLTQKNKPAGEIGNTAEYAIYVHENMESRHTVGEAKFLEKAIAESSSEILDIIKNKVKV